MAGCKYDRLLKNRQLYPAAINSQKYVSQIMDQATPMLEIIKKAFTEFKLGATRMQRISKKAFMKS